MKRVPAGLIGLVVFLVLYPGGCASGDCKTISQIPMPFFSSATSPVWVIGAMLIGLLVFVSIEARRTRRRQRVQAEDPDALFSVVRSMWGMVTPNLRAVAYLLTDSALHVRFIYEDQPHAWLEEQVSFAETECIADFWQTHQVSYAAEHLAPPHPIVLKADERLVFKRYEPSGTT